MRVIFESFETSFEMVGESRCFTFLKGFDYPTFDQFAAF